MSCIIQQLQRSTKENSFFDLNFSCLCVSHSEKTAGLLMHTGRYVFAQVMDYLPMYEFHKCVDRYNGDYRVRFTCMDQYLSMAFAQLTYRESLRDIVPCKISGTIWASGETFRRAHWPMPMKIEIGASMPISVMFLSVLPGTCTEMKISLSNLTIWHMPLILPQSTFVCLFFPGRISEKRRVR